MPDLSRRGFLTHVSIATGVGIAGGLGLHQLLAAPASSAATLGTPEAVPQPLTQPDLAALAGVRLAGPMVIHVRDVATGEVAMLLGTREHIYRDTDLVARLVKTAVSASIAEG